MRKKIIICAAFLFICLTFFVFIIQEEPVVDDTSQIACIYLGSNILLNPPDATQEKEVLQLLMRYKLHPTLTDMAPYMVTPTTIEITILNANQTSLHLILDANSNIAYQSSGEKYKIKKSVQLHAELMTLLGLE